MPSSELVVPARMPRNEAKRLQAVKRSGMMDSEVASRFSIYVDMAKRIADCPVAYTGLLDEHRQYFLAQSFEGSIETLTEVARDKTLCQYALLHTQPLVVPDLREHPQLKHNALVTDDPHWVFWVGVPLVTSDGLVLGTLCVVDYKPRTLDDETIALLQRLAANLTLVIELQADQRDATADRLGDLLKTLDKEVPGVDFVTARAFVDLCLSKPLSGAGKAALQAAGLADEHAAITAEGRKVQTSTGLFIPDYNSAPRVFAQHNIDELLSGL